MVINQNPMTAGLGDWPFLASDDTATMIEEEPLSFLLFFFVTMACFEAKKLLF